MAVKVGITTGWEPGINVKNWPSIYVNKDVPDMIYKSGGLPYLLPVTENLDLVESLLDNIDAVVLSGETLSIKQNVIKENETNQLRRSNPKRYDFETQVLKYAIKKNIPILGICRGFQVMNVELGGTVSDYDININNFVVHQQGELKPPCETIHTINIDRTSKLFNAVQSTTLSVNSFHRQGVLTVAPNFIASATSEDGNVEAIEMQGDNFVLGLQFHPEMLQGDAYLNIFKEFIQSAKK